jgi:hypothetical protein
MVKVTVLLLQGFFILPQIYLIISMLYGGVKCIDKKNVLRTELVPKIGLKA